MKWRLKSGRRIIGELSQHGEAFRWKATASFSTRDEGVTDSLDNAVLLIQKSAGMTPRQYEFSLEPVAPKLLGGRGFQPGATGRMDPSILQRQRDEIIYNRNPRKR